MVDLKQTIFLFVIPIAAAGFFFLLSTGGIEVDGIFFFLWAELQENIMAAAAVFFGVLYILQRRPRPVYLVDFACLKPPDSLRCTHEKFMEATRQIGDNSEEVMEFMKKILERSGLGPSTYLPEGLMKMPIDCSFTAARKEAELMVFGAVDKLLAKTGVEAKEIGIVIVNCGVYSQTPSISAMIVNRYKLGERTLTYNLSSMGCTASLISIGLARSLLQLYPNTYCLVTSLEPITPNRYKGDDRNMVLTNCLFRMGSAAILLSNRPSLRRLSKYELLHSVLTHHASADRSYLCIRQHQDDRGHIGFSLSKDLMLVAANALKANLTSLGPLVLPLSEQIRFFLLSKSSSARAHPPNLRRAFEHFCIHAGGRAVLDEMERRLGLEGREMEASRMTLYRFGNVSSSSPWYELAYVEAKGRVRKGDRVWQVAFGSGFKCKSAVWRALRGVDEGEEGNVWAEEIGGFPV